MVIPVLQVGKPRHRAVLVLPARGEQSQGSNPGCLAPGPLAPAVTAGLLRLEWAPGPPGGLWTHRPPGPRLGSRWVLGAGPENLNF